MPHLVPHLLLRANPDTPSEIAIALRDANYLVSRVDDDALACALVGFEHIDGVIVDLPPLDAANFSRKLASAPRRVPAVVVSSAHADHAEIVSYVDLLMARSN